MSKNKIKMRNNNKPDAICCNCGNDRCESILMFDVCIGGKIMTICDACNNTLLFKTLSADCIVNAKVKTAQDMEVIARRNRRSDKTPSRSINEALKGVKDVD